MSPFDRFVGIVTGYSKTAIVVMAVASAAMAAGAPMVEQSSSLDQFQTDSVEAEKLDAIESNFSTGGENTTTVQIVQRQPDGNVLDKESLLASLRYQEQLRSDDRTADSVTGDRPTIGIANVIARAAIRQAEAEDVRELASEIRTLNDSIARRQAALAENRTQLRADRAALDDRTDAVNDTSRALRGGLERLRANPDLSADRVFDEVQANGSVALNETDRAIFTDAAADLRNASTQEEAEAAFRRGTRGVLRDNLRAIDERAAELRERGDRLERRAAELESDAEELESLADQLETERAEVANASDASLADQRDRLRSMNESEIDDTIELVLGENSEAGAFGLVPTSYEPGSTETSATVILVTQEAETANAGSGAASEAVTNAQLAMEEIATDREDDHEYLAFGAGIINDETSAAQEDSLLIVGPLAALFVVLTLIVAYRDLLDILLGVTGIATVLGWTFGFMGWVGIDFNQIFVAVPVLLIGLSIDYAIHIFMRHREERTASDGWGPRRSMAVALSGVGIALVWVTATTVIGFLSNLVSPVGPIQEFGVVSSVGITAAFLVFTVLVPALKVELDESFERVGLDREKRAFGTGGGVFSSALSVGSTAARRAPLAVIVLALVVTGVAAVGGSQVDTSFEQEDFLADQPPEWTEELPEPFRPGEFTAKESLQFVNDNFVRQDSQAQILIEDDGGGIASAEGLARVEAAENAAVEQNVTLVLSNGEPDVQSPLSVMESVAATNETFNETYTAADTDDDGVPDENVTAVYDALFEVAPDRAASVIQRENGEYVAVRVVVSVRGGAGGDAITEQMRAVADAANAPGYTVTATGTPIVNKIVQDDLLDTVIESLLITLVAVFLFLMITYRITDGSATLGAVTLLPVAFSVAWILGTMFVAGIPFNVLTGLITSLTVGLGVAYSIHLSERYNQELERTGDVWTAMETAVTGTGGALLGSAATTVGGFGTLAFAILPPLRQFGIITGMTIVYAFLAAVLVLPSLLVVWTRFFGPAEAAAQIVDDEPPARPVDEDGVTASGAAGDGASDAAASGGNVPAGGNVSAGDGVAASDGTRTVGEAAGRGAEADEDGFVPASLVTDDLRAARRLDRTHVAPGDDVTIETRIENGDGRFVLRERVTTEGPARDGREPDAAIRMQSAEPEPVDVIERGRELNVAFDAEGTVTVSYELSIPEGAGDGSRFRLDGAVLTDDRDHEVGGGATVTVVSDLFERIIAAGEVSDADLTLARRRLDAGELSDTQFDRIRRAWLRQSGRPALSPGEEESARSDGSGGDGSDEPGGRTTSDTDGGDADDRRGE